MFENNWILNQKNTDSFDIIENIKKSRPDVFAVSDCIGYDCLNDPFLIDEMNDSVNCILKHLKNKSSICIHGDYDADGVTSSFILYDFLKTQNLNVEYFIPDRFDDGYGISIDNAIEMAKKNYNLIITTDCGITAVDEINYLVEKGLDVIVTDHHHVKDVLPNATAILCNTRKDNKYPYPFLSGAGMAFKLVHALSIELGLGDLYKKYIPYCAVGTIADIVPLTGENRVIASLGLKSLANEEVIGLDAIMETAGIDKRNINSYDIGFMIGPRINAAGRMGNADIAFELLNETVFKKALEKAEVLSKLNNLRKNEQEKTFKILREYIFNNLDLLDAPVLVVCRKGLHKGVLGIVASKLVNIFNKPVFVLNEENGVCEGSGRSVEGFNLIKALDEVSEHLIGYGGHGMAAGMRLKMENLQNLVYGFKQNQKSSSNEYKSLKIDAFCEPADLSLNFVKELEILGPFGSGNPSPVLAMKGVKIVSKRLIGRNKNHISFEITSGGYSLKCISFNAEAYEHLIKCNQLYDIAFIPEINNYMNSKSVQVRLIDIRISESITDHLNEIALFTYIKHICKNNGEFNYDNLAEELYSIGMPVTAEMAIKGCIKFYITRKDIEMIYKSIEIMQNIEILACDSQKRLKLILSLEILSELGIIDIDRKGLFSYDIININRTRKNELENSIIYRSLLK